MDKKIHKSGYVNIVGQPNVGKSSLINALMDDKLSIITSKPQTTRHRILGILSEDDYQIILSDSPGVIDDPAYGLQSKMNKFVYESFEDADVLLFVIDLFEKYSGDENIIKAIKHSKTPKFFIVNKIDLDTDGTKTQALIDKWSELIEFNEIIALSAKEKFGIDNLLEKIKLHLPEGPAYYPKDQFTDKPEKFFVSEIIREKILKQYKQEIPYSVEVVVEEFKEGKANKGDILRIRAVIYVSRETQKAIIIGHKGAAIKKLGIEARKDLEEFFAINVFLETYVKVKENWRNDDRLLKQFGYSEQ